MLPTNPLLNATAPAGPHLPTATLRQYAAGTLAPAARHRVEAHTLACPRCADILDGLLQTTPVTTDQALAQLQQRLRRRVQQQSPAALPVPRIRSRNRWLVPQLAAAATLLFGLLAGGWWTWQQRHAAPAAVATAPVAATSAPATVREVPVAPIPAAAARQAARAPHHLPALAAVPRRLARSKAAQAAAGAAIASQPIAEPSQPVAAAPAPVATSAASSYPSQSAQADIDSRHLDTAATQLRGRVAGVAASPARLVPAAASALVRDRAMPAAPPVPPTPAGGYPAWREKIRREATEFRPEAGEQPLSGAVQLRVTIGADGKIQEVRVLHGLRADYDEEAQRVVCDGPGWVPGIGGGKRSTQAVDVTVPFQ